MILPVVVIATVAAGWVALRAIVRTGTATLLLVGAMASVFAVAALLVLQ